MSGDDLPPISPFAAPVASRFGRAFVAVVPPPAVLESVASLLDTLGGALRGARLTGREQWHLTLQFLGDHADLDACRDALLASVPAALAPARVQLGGLGAFPSERRARVLWLGAREGDAWLRGAADAVAAALAPSGFEPDHRAAHPHLTLARFRTPVDARPIVERNGSGDTVGDAWSVGELVLVQSTLGRSGATHRVHARVALDEGA